MKPQHQDNNHRLESSVKGSTDGASDNIQSHCGTDLNSIQLFDKKGDYETRSPQFKKICRAETILNGPSEKLYRLLTVIVNHCTCEGS